MSRRNQKSEESKLQVYRTARINKVSNKITDKTLMNKTPAKSIKKVKKVSKKSPVKKTDPFLALGENIVKNVDESMKLYPGFEEEGRSSLEVFNQNYKRILTRYLIFGGYELFKENGFEDFMKTSLEYDEVRVMFNLATRIQESIYTEYQSDLKNYQSRCKMILNNIKDYSNPELRKNLIQGIMQPSKLATATQSQLDPPHRIEAKKQKLRILMIQSVLQLKEDNSDNPECTYQDYDIKKFDPSSKSKKKKIIDNFNNKSDRLKALSQKH